MEARGVMTGERFPTGTVTFLFSDIEGSTRLAGESADRWPELLERHRRLLRAAFAEHRGVEVKTEGDGFFVAFAAATDAVCAAIDAQRAISAEDWPADASIRVRIGIHTGEAHLVDDDYIGVAVHHAARVAAVAHGGQIVVSETANGLVTGVGLLDLGLHRLKDIPAPMRLFQATAPDLPERFPPLRSFAGTPTNLPQTLTELIGRTGELDEVRSLVSNHRLVTLTGSGGAGKTRLSLEVASQLLEDFPDGVWLVELASLADGALLARSMGEVVGLRPDAKTPPVGALVSYFGGQRSLVVLDNCEHLLGEVAELVHTLLMGTRELHFLSTSREALGVSGEQAWRIPSLGLEDDDLGPAPAVRLFVERAKAAEAVGVDDPEARASILQICRRLDGLPLAIELAAARMRSLRPDQLAERLDDRFRLLTGGSRTALPRQQTLLALIDWSHQLLTDAERVLLRRLSVFSGGFTLAAAERVCSDASLDTVEVLDALDSLVRKSLAVSPGDGPPRYRLLETIRAYARSKLLESDEMSEFRGAHAEWVLEATEDLAARLRKAVTVEALDAFADEHDNIRAALEWVIESGSGEMALRLAHAPWHFWFVRGHWREGADWIKRALDCASDADAELRLGATFALSQLVPFPDSAVALQAYDLAKSISSPLQYQAAWAVGRYLYDKEDLTEADRYFAEAEAGAAEVGDYLILNWSRLLLGVAESASASWRARTEEVLRQAKDAGDLWCSAMALNNLSYGQPRSIAVPYLEEAYEAYRELDDAFGAVRTMFGLASRALSARRLEEARLWIERAETRDRATGSPQWADGGGRATLLGIAVALGDEGAIQAIETPASQGTSLIDQVNRAAWYCIETGVPERAEPVLGTLARLVDESENGIAKVNALHTLAEAYRLLGDRSSAVTRFEELRICGADLDSAAAWECLASLGIAAVGFDSGERESVLTQIAALFPEVLSSGSQDLAIGMVASVAFGRSDLSTAARLVGSVERGEDAVSYPGGALADSLEAELRLSMGDEQYEREAGILANAGPDELTKVIQEAASAIAS